MFASLALWFPRKRRQKKVNHILWYAWKSTSSVLAHFKAKNSCVLGRSLKESLSVNTCLPISAAEWCSSLHFSHPEAIGLIWSTNQINHHCAILPLSTTMCSWSEWVATTTWLTLLKEPTQQQLQNSSMAPRVPRRMRSRTARTRTEQTIKIIDDRRRPPVQAINIVGV